MALTGVTFETSFVRLITLMVVLGKERVLSLRFGCWDFGSVVGVWGICYDVMTFDVHKKEIASHGRRSHTHGRYHTSHGFLHLSHAALTSPGRNFLPCPRLYQRWGCRSSIFYTI